MRNYLLYLFIIPNLLTSSLSYGHELIGDDFYDGSSYGYPPKVLLVNSKLADADPLKITDELCKKLGFQNGLKGAKIDNLGPTRFGSEKAFAIDYLNHGLGAVPLAELFGEQSTLKYFQSLECHDNPSAESISQCSSATAGSFPGNSSSDVIESLQGVASAALELETFAKVKQDPDVLLKEMYNQSRQILALGESNHENYRMWEHVKKLLEKVGLDPKLKFIALERPPHLDVAYRVASLHSTQDESFKKLIPSSIEHGRIFGGSMLADRYFVSQILPLIVAINKQRPKIIL